MLELEFNEAVSACNTLFHSSSLLCVGTIKITHLAQISNNKVKLAGELIELAKEVKA